MKLILTTFSGENTNWPVGPTWTSMVAADTNAGAAARRKARIATIVGGGGMDVGRKNKQDN